MAEGDGWSLLNGIFVPKGYESQESPGSVSKVAGGVSNVTRIIIFLIIALLIVIASIYVVRWGVEQTWWPKIGVQQTSTPINTESGIGKAVGWIMGSSQGVMTWEDLLIRLSILLILTVGVADILIVFSSFRSGTSWIIAGGLAVIASASGWVTAITELMGIASGIGAIGIALILFGSVIAAVTLNMGIGGVVRTWRMNRQIEVEAIKAHKGTARVTEAVKGLKQIERQLSSGESE